MSHLESLIAEYLDWQGFIVKRNIRVGRLAHGGWEMELDIVGYHPSSGDLVHYEPSIDALSWARREARYTKKFRAGRQYIFSDRLFSWLPLDTPLQQIAVLVSHPRNRDTLAGGILLSVDELMKEIRTKIVQCGNMAGNAVPEQYPLLRTVQLTHVGYHRALQ